MDAKFNRHTIASFIIPFLYIVLFASIFVSFRAITSISIGLLIVAGIVQRFYCKENIPLNKMEKLLLGSCTLYFLLQVTSAFLIDESNPWKDVQLKSGILLFPLSVVLAGFPERKFLLQSYCTILASALLYCIINAILLSQVNNDNSHFFYHSLVRPLKQHAVYMALFVFAALVILLEKTRQRKYMFVPALHYSFILFFSGCLLLLSSKLVLFFYFLCLIYYLLSFTRVSMPRKKTSLLLSAVIAGIMAVILITKNPISNRFRDMLSGDPELAQKEVFHPGIYFNGIQFRLLHLRLVPGILTQENKWLTGVGADRAQDLIDEEYRSRNMYLGEPSGKDRGYLGLNTHNQFLESLLKYGIFGLLFFLFICFSLLTIAWQNRKAGVFPILLILLLYALVESVLETQYGIFLFTFIPALCARAAKPTFYDSFSI